ncbi:MAG: PEP-CTERM sorting domain-containing protein [Pseudomonadales bacterium]
MKNKILGTLSLLSILAVQPANAAFITDVSSLTGAVNLIDFSEFTGSNQHNRVNGPINIGTPVGEDIQVSTTQDPEDLWLTNTTWGLGDNQAWNTGRDGFLGMSPSSPNNSFPIKISFNTANISGFGFLMNFYSDALSNSGPANISNLGPISISAFDTGATLLEEFIINGSDSTSINTPTSNNDGAFRGIKRDSADIAYIELLGFRSVFDDLQFTRAVTSSIPEPGSILLLMLGLAGIGASTRNNKQAH